MTARRQARMSGCLEDGHSFTVEDRDHVPMTPAKKTKLARETETVTWLLVACFCNNCVQRNVLNRHECAHIFVEPFVELELAHCHAWKGRIHIMCHAC